MLTLRPLVSPAVAHEHISCSLCKVSMLPVRARMRAYIHSSEMVKPQNTDSRGPCLLVAPCAGGTCTLIEAGWQVRLHGSLCMHIMLPDSPASTASSNG